ncbi:hypothetical protein Ocin01_03381 [Orchesella cincta]|uniref:DUF243 domain-containing protein n=1 Tax=Orchesella cincta TaxID=48709 RepID=A0A1D2NDE2_ORCCI|nr:hypothetical protein Ocin01_03381 [Orchesella cincta]
MKIFLSLPLLLPRQKPLGGYSGGGSSGSFPAGGSFNFGNGGYTTGFSGASSGGDSFVPDPEDQATKTVRVPGGGNKHVNIIFVKSPSNGADQKTEIVLPEQDEQKNLVYVLVQKTDVAANLRIQKPAPTKPAKPEVYFIKYAAPQQQAGGNAAGGPGGDFRAPSGPANVPSAAYGAP